MLVAANRFANQQQKADRENQPHKEQGKHDFGGEHRNLLSSPLIPY
jgi:hypothetical protein